jgi:hypothetical protein
MLCPSNVKFYLLSFGYKQINTVGGKLRIVTTSNFRFNIQIRINNIDKINSTQAYLSISKLNIDNMNLSKYK